MGRISGLDIKLKGIVGFLGGVKGVGRKVALARPADVLAVLVHNVDAASRGGRLNRPCVIFLVVGDAAERALDGKLLALVVDEVEARPVGRDRPDDGGVRGLEHAVGRGDRHTGLIIGRNDLLGERLALRRVVEHDLVAVLQRSGLDVLVAGRLRILAQLCAAAIAELVLIFVDMTQSRNLLSLGVAALRAGVGLDALFRAGRFGRDLARVPDVVAGGCGVRSLAGRGLHIIRNILTENQPCILRIVDEDVAVALNGLRLVVARHFPCVDRVALAPLEQGVKAFDDLFAVVGIVVGIEGGQILFRDVLVQVRLTPAAVDIEQDAGDVALDVVAHLNEIVACGVPQDGAAAVIGGGAAVDHAVDIAHGVVVAGGVDRLVGRAQVVQIAAAIFLIEGGAALRPDVLAVVARAGLIGVKQNVVVGRRPELSQRLIADGVRLRRGHQRLQALIERAVHRGDAVGVATGQGGHFVIGVSAGVISLCHCAQARTECVALVGVLCRSLKRYACKQRCQQGNEQKQRHRAFDVLHLCVLSFMIFMFSRRAFPAVSTSYHSTFGHKKE